MSPFRYARDYYGGSAAQQLLPAAAAMFALLVLLCIAIHLLRRASGQPVSTIAAGKLPSEARLRKYDLGARLYHWGNLIFFLALAVSGVALFDVGLLGRGPWLRVHEFAALGFTAALLLHIIVAPIKGEARSMWFEARDGRDLRLIVANFFGRTREYPAFGKYDPLQKLYHALLALLSAGVIFSGVYLLASAEVWKTFTHAWLRDMRLVHDVAGFAFIAILIGHVYFGIIRVNWPQLVSMFTGRLKGASFNLYHDAERWRPEED